MTDAGKMERRSAVAEVRATGRKAEGYAAVFGAVADLGGGLSESIKPGAFSATLRANSDVLAFMDHDPAKLLGRTRSGTLKLAEDTRGLHFELDLPNTQFGNDVRELATRGDLGGMSFGFLTPKGGDVWTGSKRSLNKIDLREISVISSVPAYADTEIAVRFLHHISDHERRGRVLMLAEMNRWA